MEKDKINTSEKFKFKEKAEYSTDGIVSKKIIQKTAGNVTLFAFDKDQELSEHSTPYDAIVQVLDGKAEILIDRKPFILEAHECIIMPANIPHAVKAVEKFKMLLTMIRE